jgi:gluconate 2-dehydrogenase gamma chain
MDIDRRDVLRLLGSVAMAPQVLTALAAPAAGYVPRFLTPSEFTLVDRLTHALLPADAEGGGAHEANVARFIDIVLQYESREARQRWKAGLAEVAVWCEERTPRGAAGMQADDWTAVVTSLFQGERQPATDLDRFAARLKDLTVQGFATSDAGLKYFGYTGNTAVATFRGCDHPEHRP